MNFDVILETPSYIEKIKASKRPVLIYGTGDGGDKIIKYLEENNVKITAYAVSDEFYRGQEFRGKKVKPLSDYSNNLSDYSVVSVFALEGDKANIFFDLSKKCDFYAPNLPPYGENQTDKRFIYENQAKIEKIFNRLGDNFSKEMLFDHLMYCVTADVFYLKNYNEFSPTGYISHSIEHIDIGAYNGDTVISYTAFNPYYGGITAVEPDPSNFNKMKANTSALRNITYINAAAWNTNGEGCFTAKGSRGSTVSDKKNLKIPFITIDNLCGQHTVDKRKIFVGSIKIDGEGVEEQIIAGASNTIYSQKPAICTAVYHRFDDIIKIPLTLLYHNPSYTLYFRRKKYVPAFDVFIYAVSD